MVSALSNHWRMMLAALASVGLLSLAGYALAGNSDVDATQEEFSAAWAAASEESPSATAEPLQLAQAAQDQPVERPPIRRRGSTTLPAGATDGRQAQPLPPGSDRLPPRTTPNESDDDPTRRFRDHLAQRRANARPQDAAQSPATQPSGDMSIDSHALPDVSDDELEALRERIRSGRRQPPSEAGASDQTSAQTPAAQPAQPPAAPPAAGTTPPSATPPAPTTPPVRPTVPPRGSSARTPAPAAPATPPGSGTPTATSDVQGREGYAVETDAQGGKKLVQPKNVFRLPLEERMFFFVWKNTPLQKTFEDVCEMAGLNPIGQIDPADQQQQITFESVEMQSFDDALTTYNELLAEKGYWVLRLEDYLGVRRLSDWYRYIPPSRMYPSVEAYEQAKLPMWELASVIYEPKNVSPSQLAVLLIDSVPDNTARATVVPDSNKIELKGFILYVQKMLDLAVKVYDVEKTDGREWRAYPLKYAAASIAVEMLAELMPPSSSGASVVRAQSTPSATPGRPSRGTPPGPAAAPAAPVDVGTSTADDVDIRENKRKNELLVRASEAKHKLVEKYMAEYIDVPLITPDRREVFKLQYADPAELVEQITPLLGRRELYQPPPPPPRQGPGGQMIEQPAPPPQFRSIGSTAVLVPMAASRSILVKATEDEMAQIKEYIGMLDQEAPNEKLQYVELQHGSASNIASVVGAVFGQRASYRPGARTPASEGLKVIPDSATDRAIILSGGDPKEMEDAKALIAKLDVDPQAGAVEHIVILESATPSALAETLSSRYSQSGGGGGYHGGRSYYGGSGGNTLPRFLPDDNSKMLIVLCREEMWDDIHRLIKQVDERSKSSAITRTYRLKHVDAAMMTSILSESLSSRGGGGGRRGYYYGMSLDPNAPMFVYEPQSNAIVVTALEEVHAKAKELIDQLDVPSAADQAGWRTIQLTKADAGYVESVIENLFERGGRRGGYGGRYYGGGYGADSSGGAGKVPVRIVAESVSNRLFVSASDEDFAKIEETVKQIDADYAAKEIVRRTFELSYAEPSEVSEIIQTTFEARTSGRSRGGFFGGGMSSDGPNLGVKVAEIGRGIIVQAPKDKMEEIAQLVKEVDTDATAGNEIRTYKVTGSDYRGTYELANNLRQLFGKDGPGGRSSGASNLKFIGEYGSNLLLVSAPSHRMPEIDKRVREMIDAKQGADLTMTIRHFDIQRARPQEIADIIEPVLETKYQELQQQSGGGRSFGWGGWGGSSGPRVTVHKGQNRIMVSAPSALMPTVEELISEFDRPPRPSTTRIISLMTAKATDLAPIVEEQIASTSGGSSSSSRRRDFGGWWGGWGSRSRSSESNTELTVTAVESSNSIILTGAEEKVAEAEQLVKKLDEGARPEGMFKVIQIQDADLQEVADMVEEVVGGGSSRYSYSSRRGVSSAGGATVTVRTDYQTNQLIVYAPPEKFPIIEQVVAQMENLAAARIAKAHESGRPNSTVIGTSGKEVTLLYDVKGPAKEIAEILDKGMYELYGWDAPYIKPYTFTNQIIVQGDPKYFPQVEKMLQEVEKNPPQPKIMVAARRVKDPQRLIAQIQRLSPVGVNIRPIVRPGGLQSPMDMINQREVNYWDPIEPPAAPAGEGSAQPVSANPFVAPAGELARMQASLNAIKLSQAATIAATQPAATPPSKAAAAPASRPAETGSASENRTAAQMLLEGFRQEGQATTQPAAADGQAAAPKASPAAAPAKAQAPKAGTVAEKPAAQQSRQSPEERMYSELSQAAGQARESDEVQVRYDPEQGLIFIVGREGQVKEFDYLLDTIVKELEDIEDATKTEFRVVRVEHIAVEVAAHILETMFNDTVPAQQQQRRQQGARRSGQGGQGAQQGQDGGQDRDGEESSGSQRRREEEEQKKQEEEAAKAAAAAAQRIKVIPDPRTNTLIIRAAPETFPVIAELLLKIDRPGGGQGVKIRLFQLEKLNAGEVEQAIKAILKIDDGTRRLRTGRAGLGGLRGGRGSPEADLIERLEEQMLELQMQQMEAASEASAAQAGKDGQNGGVPGKMRLNPAKDIMITSDATTNTIIVSSTDEGIDLVHSLIKQLEELEVPLEVKTFVIQNGDAEKIAAELEKVFGPDRTGGGRRGIDGFTPGRGAGDVKIAANSRAGTIVVRALKPDMEKIAPIIQEMDVAPKEQQVQIYPVNAGSATEMAATLTKIFVEPGETGPRAVRITADAETNSLLVYAPTEAKQLLIAAKIKELDEKSFQSATAKQVELRFANATSVASKLTEIFVPRGRRNVRGAQRIEITGDDNSGILFVVAPDEIFKQIQKVAMDLDRPSKQEIQVFPLKHAAATEVEAQFKALMTQMSVALRGGAEPFGVTPDPRTNSLIVVGSPTTMIMVDTALKKLDIPPGDDTAETVAMYPITGGGAAAVAASINALYAGVKFPGGKQPPRAVASGNDMVYVYGTGQQLQQIKALVIDPLEAYRKPQIAAVKESTFTVQHANADEVAKKLQAWFKTRNDALTAAGTTPVPSEAVVQIMPDSRSKMLFVQSSDSNRKQIEELLKIFDRPEVSEAGLQVKVIPVQYTDVTYAYQALVAVFNKSDRPVNERPVITYEYGTRSLVVKALPDDMKQIEETLAQIDRPDANKVIPPETVRIEKVKATEIAAQLTSIIAQTKRRDARTGVFPVNVTGNDSNNTVVITAKTQEDLDEVKTLIAKLDSRPADDMREVRSYALKYADLGATIQAINANFAANAGGPLKNQVSALPDYTTSSLLVTASAENHAEVAKIIAELDRSNIGIQRTTETVKVNNLRATVLADRLNAHIRQTMRVDRRTGTYPVSVTGDDTSNVVMVNANAEHMADIKALIEQLDVRMDGDQREVRSYALKYADLGATIQAINANFAANAGGPLKNQVSALPDYTTSSLLVTASAENHEEVAKIIAQLDKSNIGIQRTTETVKVRNLRATVLAERLNAHIRQTMRVDRRTGTYPVSVTGDDASNVVMVNANAEHMAEIKALIEKLDVKSEDFDDRIVKPYVVQYADLTAVYQTVLSRFPVNASKTNRDLVAVGLDYTNSTVIVTASPENHETVAALIAELDRLDNVGRKETRAIVLNKARASDVAATLTATIRATAPQRRTPPPTVQANDATNSLLVTSTEKEFADIEKLVKEILDVEPSADAERTLKVYSLKYADLYSVIAAINSSFRSVGTRRAADAVDAVAESGTYSAVVMANAENHEKVAKLIADLDQPGAATRQTFTVELKYADPDDIVATLTNIYNNPMARTQRGSGVPAVFNVLQGSRKVLVTTTELEMEKVRQLIEQLDVEEAANARGMRVVQLNRIAPQEMVTMLQAYLRKPGRPGGRAGGELLGDVNVVASIGANSVVLTGPEDRLDDLEQLASKIDADAGERGSRQIEVIPLTNADAASVAAAINSTFAKTGQVAEGERVQATAERTTNTVVVTAMPEKLEQVRTLVDSLDANSSNTPKQEIITLEHARAADLVEVLTQTYRASRRAGGGPQITFAADTNGNAVVVSAGETDLAGIRDMIAQLDRPATDRLQEMRVMPLEAIDATETMNLLNEHFRKPGGAGGRRGGSSGELIGGIRIQASAIMNALIVSGTAEELDKIQAMVQQMDKQVVGAGAPKIIKVEHIPAGQLAQTLTQMFTDPAKATRGRTSPDSVPLIVAEEASGSLLVRARAVDYALIEDMVKTLDVPSEDGQIRVLRVSRGRDVAAMAKMIQDTVNNGELAKQQLQKSYRAGRVSIGYDERVPALIVAGTPDLFKQVEALVNQLDGMNTNGSPQTIIIRTKSDPAKMKTILDQVIERHTGVKQK
ncbi:MAG TPA: secretin N-terminal domain-containing protein [Phycisphaerae bacterium]|nr:secretin N-terminal domain-containing protein [Phycisphaerae bacterium]